ncbi:F-BAR and double SH3 domains protein 2-like [Protopterus annectens]|uniref:F-BAR and double SH3 domains protein 2-like n=1 Tax=Protopterus annectens TaxID=7888 RepID=UPI001CFB2804|nr:F-BAR and double SH3 domains protein 2-like [Protopterus annectens]
MQPPPRKVKLTQELKLCLTEQVAKLQSKHQQESELLEDIRNFIKQRAAIEKEYGQALQRLALQYLKKDIQRLKGENDNRSIYAVSKMIIESTNAAGQARVTASENFRNLGVEIVKTVRVKGAKT